MLGSIVIAAIQESKEAEVEQPSVPTDEVTAAEPQTAAEDEQQQPSEQNAEASGAGSDVHGCMVHLLPHDVLASTALVACDSPKKPLACLYCLAKLCCTQIMVKPEISHTYRNQNCCFAGC